MELSAHFQTWLNEKGWQLHPHQIQMLTYSDEQANLLIAPTGGGKTLAGFLPSLSELAQCGSEGLHTLYVSPLKALAADIGRNLRTPAEELGLDIRIEERTGDTPASKRARQRRDPPDILLTTPESLALLISYEEAPQIFAGLRRVVIDEIHTFSESKRGDQLVLALSRLQTLCPNLKRVGLSATVDDPAQIAEFLSAAPGACRIIHAEPGPAADIDILQTRVPPPWAGAGGRYAICDVLDAIKTHRTTLIFHNTRAQAELFFHHLWMENKDDIPIALHHGSLGVETRRKVEAAMGEGRLRAIICTGTLDLGLDWGDVDLVIQIGAPKNIKRLVQRIGRANHCYSAPSKARLVPANRFEVLECFAALNAVRAGELDHTPKRAASLDVLCQHILICASSAPFQADALFAEIKTAASFAQVSREEFDRCLEFCATGGYALRAYDRWQRLRQDSQGFWQLRDPRSAQRIRMNIGTIQDSDTIKVRLKNKRGGKALGEIEEAFATSLTQGDTFLIAGQVVRYEGLRELTVEVSPAPGKKPKIASFWGTKFATSLELSERILALINDVEASELPQDAREWLALQKRFSQIPRSGTLLIESFAHDGLEYSAIYGFAGRNAQQSLGLLLTKSMEEEGLAPLGFLATDYASLIWGLKPLLEPVPLLELARLKEGLEGWLAQSAIMKRGFRSVATISGLIETQSMGQRKSGRQATFSSDILYDTLRKYDPEHILLEMSRVEAMRGLVDFGRIEELIEGVSGRIELRRLSRPSPFAAPLLLEVGRVPVKGRAEAELLEQFAEQLPP